MAYVSTQTRGAAAPTLSTLGELRARFDKWRMFRRTLAELQELSPRELDDLGIAPGTLRAVAHETVYGKTFR